ncbi:unnamed protein product [Prorocentrum cordatum]|uniref:Uncharacterized protein n=1 Tax=Prorocentrum cordatum TaxID=2364126 RepID=A0ABN9R516_9DINO|nr:unnamed protein product [Polarella glacialis]
MQRPPALRARAPRAAGLALVLLLAIGPRKVGAPRLRGAAAASAQGPPGSLAVEVPESLAQVEQRTLLAQQQALEAAVAQEERMEVELRRLEAREGRVAQRLDRLRYLEQASDVLAQVRTRAFMGDLTAELTGAAVYVGFILLVTLLYGLVFDYEYPEVQSKPAEDVLKENMGFAWNLWHGFNCDPDARICIFSCLAMPVRWADTAHKPSVQFAPFWLGLTIFTLCCALSKMTYGATYLGLLVVAVQNRQKIRESYGLDHGDNTTRVEDCLVWVCCPACATMQEAMEVEFVEPPRLKGFRRLRGGA